MKIRVLVGILVVIALILIGVFIAQHLVVSYEDKRKSPLSDITNNPMAALQHVLTQLGKEANSFQDRQPIYELPSTDHAIILRNLKEPLTTEREDALIKWIEQGGTLIYEPFWLDMNSERPYLHERLGVLIRENEDYQWGDRIHARFTQNGEEGIVHQTDEYFLELNTSSDNQDAEITGTATPILTSTNLVHGYAIGLGLGKAYFLSDTQFLDTPNVWFYDSFVFDPIPPIKTPSDDADSDTDSDTEYDENSAARVRTINLFETTTIAGHDHLAFILSLIGDKQYVWLLHDTDAPSFAAIMYQRFPFMVTTLGIWVLFYIGYLVTRFGPIKNSVPSQQRNIIQHLHQAGLFLWKLDKCQALIRHWQSQIIARLKVKHPKLSGLEEQHLLAEIAQLADMDIKDIHLALGQTVKRNKEFVKQVGLLKTLWTL